ncbi:ESSS subunit of NADH:ubiquinone oxidoreductase-domain-containing protein [Boeremia exigua]|uniref:ESSS subunit of NADH:ubiquinone oxidoreductase-domain-containing protein n=1 Tax=Boeremia exigua TaxID=749465 RepID=UPI001E8CCDF1|nr:ESSS subunit of NADH:ubiquinone oxidoreductase-domain-containing protein [Boeremia exigua]KAH6614180.1 ESSS subunit of NADH:ubiquinone oxidoreductase-domain-containing protein [Boeremia exigua]
MSAPRALRALARPAACLRAPAARAFTPPSARAFSHSVARRGGGHEHHYDPPSGWLFGVKPGEEYKKEGWETATFYVFIPLMVVFIGVYAFKPDTSIQTWALEEARRRLEAEGILADPDVKKD